jgi:hypothetical protein
MIPLNQYCLYARERVACVEGSEYKHQVENERFSTAAAGRGTPTLEAAAYSVDTVGGVRPVRNG